ncbi:hypothetical protein N9987_00735 [bacterium]|nr:hypothetical protein [bacterium]
MSIPNLYVTNGTLDGKVFKDENYVDSNGYRRLDAYFPWGGITTKLTSAGDNGIGYNPTTKVWKDFGQDGASNPKLLSSSTDFTSATDEITNPEFIHIQSGNGTYMGYLTNHDYTSGPTVTSITVASTVSATREFTVAHTGTLTANDINYKINGVDITTLTSPNTPITNLQTTSTGSTFDSYTMSSNGYHLINIGSQYLEFYKSSTTLAQTSFPELNNAGLTITFPSTSALWLAKAPGYDSVTLYNDGTQYKATIQKFGADHIEYLWVGTKYFTNADPSLRGFKWYQIIYSDNNKQWFTSDVFYIDPVAIYESTGLTTTSFLSPSQDFMTSYSFDFVSLIAQAPTNTSNGGGKRRRYPIISTNLFDRQRSIYSIGLTHKDETLF